MTTDRVKQEIRQCLLDRYGIATELTGDSLIRAFGISLGLGDLFNDSGIAENEWLTRARILGRSGIEILTTGSVVEVKRLQDKLDAARGIY